MQDKFESFDELPRELRYTIAHNLSNRDLVKLAQTSKYHLSLFKPVIDIRKLLHHVTRGEHDVVKAMLKQDINLIFKRGVVTDCSGREFDNLSGFEYALWAMDKHMWTAMIACIPSNEEGRKVFTQLMAQYNKVNKDRVTYRLNGKTITEQHFDFKNTLIKELQTQVDSINAEGDMNWDAIDKQWREGVGGAQRLLPQHVVYEYCSTEQFNPVPNFTLQPKPSKIFYNWVTHTYESWFHMDSKLSVDFAIYKGSSLLQRGRGFKSLHFPDVSGAYDLEAMTELCKVRTKDFIDLKSQLEDQMTQNNHHQVSLDLTELTSCR